MLNLNLNLLRVFIKVAECESLTKASKLLGHPKSKISRDLVKLENEMQQTLLKRSPQGVTLTEQGLNLLKTTKKHFEDLESSLEKVKSAPNEVKGSIKITAPEDLSTFLLTGLIADFMALYPEVKVELYSTNEVLDFKKYDIDIALRIGRLKDSSLVQKKVTEINVIYIASEQYLRSVQDIRNSKDLRDQSFAVIKDIFGNPLNKKLNHGELINFSSNSMLVLKEYVRQGNGIATLPSFLCQRELATKEFIQLMGQESYATSGLYLLSEKTTYPPKHVKIFKDYLFERLQKELP